jgi:hypothetical protein
MRILLSPTQALALAIAVFVRKRGAAYSAEILNAFDISESTLRRRGAALRQLGIEFARRAEARSTANRALPAYFPPVACHNARSGARTEEGYGHSQGPDMDAASAAARENLVGSPHHDENDPTRRAWITDFGRAPD